MEEFERLLAECKCAVERFVYYKLPRKADADDVLQEIYIAAYQKYGTLKDPASFKAWIISIARNKCSDYFREQAKVHEIPLDAICEKELSHGRLGITEVSVVRETLSLLKDQDQRILYLYFFRGLPQSEIAARLGIPLGTVKSRLYTAKRNFKQKYPFQSESKGACNMKKLPEYLPDYKIEKSSKNPFPVKWEELMGWFLVPKLGEKLSWGIYDIPTRKCNYIYDMQVTQPAQVHGIDGVELTAREYSFFGKEEAATYTFVAQLTDTHCRYLAAMRTENGVRKYITFLDEDTFLPNWGFGENNCGNEVNLKAKGEIVRNGNDVKSMDKSFLLDIVGRYDVTINGNCYDTVCVMDIETYNAGVASEQYLDKNGRTVLWRRFNRDDWAFDRYKKNWSEQLPENEQMIINGQIYVHWYDCITDYII